MVRKRRSVKRVLTLIPLAICIALPLSGRALAQQDGKPTITETYRVTINDVGDAQIEDTIKYDKKDYKDVKGVVADNPTFLTRLYTTERDIGEVLNFDTELDDAKSQVVITFDTPGYSYNMKDNWVIFGITNKPKKESGRTIEFEEQTDINNEFSLFTDQTLKTKTIYELPQKAKNARYNKEEKTIEYAMPEAKAQLGFWSESKKLLSVLFGILTLVFAGLLVFVITRKTVVAPASSLVTPATPPPSTAAQVAKPHTAGAPGVKEAGACKKCGKKLKPGKKFCTHCGEPI